ncbi:50S ribosome-binding GTPase [Infirmifilum lucidum]|uniref:50S ribosome-binding GTPase n=1 Tax=Infirmifilum lucidum TaxID=2776706 RepID=A0A7L9FHK5_9CREN|nr:GTPase [Infirmifilum lucidum]QOJ78255.1 50S ribosome-binding GTPase [Infirmifilum lucidum]
MNIEQLKRELVLAIPDSGVLFERAVEACKKRPPPSRYRRKLEAIREDTLKCIDRAYKVLENHLRKVVETSPFIENLHPLFRDLLLLNINVDEYKVCLSRLNSSRRIIGKIYHESRKRIKTASGIRETLTARRTFFGRIFSVLETLTECLKKVRSFQEAFLRLPEVDTELPAAVIAGAPNVGKSTVLRALTRAKPKVSPYPFTTRELIIGIFERGDLRVQLIDTPGLLDTPLEDKNRIERQAILAMRHLASLIIFVIDPTETCGFPLEFQKTVFDQIVSSFSDTQVVKVVNKIDLATQEHLDNARKFFGGSDIVYISADKKLNLNLLESVIEKVFREEAQSSQKKELGS